MRLRGAVVVAIAAMAGLLACSDSLAPRAASEGDLEFSVPVRANADAMGSSFRARRLPVSELEIAQMGREVPGLLREADESGGTGDEAVVPFIWSKYLTAGFVGSEFEFKYGFVGFGTGYVMSGRVRIVNDSGRVLRDAQLERVEENLPFLLYMHPDAEGRFAVAVACGASGEMNVHFDVYAAVAGVRYAQAQQYIMRAYTQAACPTPPPPPSDGGGGPIVTETNDGLWICYYEVWMDMDGNIIDVFALGCVRIGTYAE